MSRFLFFLTMLAVVAGAPASAQWQNVPPPSVPRTPDGKVNLSAPAPRLPDGKPDLSGVWNPPTGYLRDLSRDAKDPVEFLPEAKEIYDLRASGAKWLEEPDANCLPQGIPKVMFAPAPWRIVQTPTIVFFIHEAFNLWWQAFMDGRRFVVGPDIQPTWHGYSTAKWDGDTLVVDSVGFNGRVWLDQLGKPSTDALHVTTRLTRTDYGHLSIQSTIDDPKAYRKPWTTATVVATLQPDTELMEFICLENEKDIRGRK